MQKSPLSVPGVAEAAAEYRVARPSASPGTVAQDLLAAEMVAADGFTMIVDSHFAEMYRLSPQEKVVLIRQGRPASDLGVLAAAMAVPKEMLIDALGYSRATINRKAREADLLSSEESERLLGLEAMIGQVETMVAESGDPAGFNASHWLGQWMSMPMPSLGGRTPASYFDTVEGQKLVVQLLAMVQSGAYT